LSKWLGMWPGMTSDQHSQFVEKHSDHIPILHEGPGFQNAQFAQLW
jgi:hypothetical protein